MPVRLRAILISFALSTPALAWEPQSPAAVQSRIEELQKAWAGKSPEEIAQDKVARSRQARPQWASKSAWKMDLGPVTYYFAVGKAGFARAAGAAGADTPSAPAAGRPLDWWYDDASATFYTLVVDAR
jgi:hypothetical protein